MISKTIIKLFIPIFIFIALSACRLEPIRIKANDPKLNFQSLNSKSWSVMPTLNGYFAPEFAAIVDERIDRLVQKKRADFIKNPPAKVRGLLASAELRDAYAKIAAEIYSNDQNDKYKEEYGTGISAKVIDATAYVANVKKTVSLIGIEAVALQRIESEVSILSKYLGTDIAIIPYVSTYSPNYSRSQFWMWFFPVWMSKKSMENIFVNFYAIDLKSGTNVLVVKMEESHAGKIRTWQIDRILKQVLYLKP